MTKDDVLAVVVSYNGLDRTARTVDALRPQVARVHIVDNGSDAASLAALARLEQDPAVTVERLGENRGIGVALNRGVARARSEGRSWLLTMDQDSVAHASMIHAYETALAREPGAVSLTVGNREGRPGDGTPVSVPYAITSGNLVRADVFDRVGPYDEGLSIDCVDFDFSLRLRRAGQAILRVPAATMTHQLGESVRPRRFYAEHSPVRRYYMYRNYLYLAERYLLRFPGFILKLGVLQALLAVLVGIHDPRPLASYRAMVRGMADYFARRHGPDPAAAR